LQVGDTGPVESARRSNSRVLGSPFSGLSGHVQIITTSEFGSWSPKNLGTILRIRKTGILIHLRGLALQSVGDFFRVIISARILCIREKYLVLKKNDQI
jgi:hypothetical protein